MKKSLFTDENDYTQESNRLSLDVTVALLPIYKKCLQNGYSLREVHYIIEQVSQELHLAGQLKWTKFE
jgi:hypothetical protein